MKKGVIQNSVILYRALYEDKDFLVLCENEKDANSKRVSLYNARSQMPRNDQAKLRLQKVFFEDQWFIKVSKHQNEVYELVNGKLIPVIDEIADDSAQMMKEMLEQGLSNEEIVTILASHGELKRSVEKKLEEVKNEPE